MMVPAVGGHEAFDRSWVGVRVDVSAMKRGRTEAILYSQGYGPIPQPPFPPLRPPYLPRSLPGSWREKMQSPQQA